MVKLSVPASAYSQSFVNTQACLSKKALEDVCARMWRPRLSGSVWEYIRTSLRIYATLEEWRPMEMFQSFIYGNVRAFSSPTANFPIELEPRGTDMGVSLFTRKSLKNQRLQHFSSLRHSREYKSR